MPLLFYLLFGLVITDAFKVGKKRNTLTLATKTNKDAPEDDASWDQELESEDAHSRLVSQIRKSARPHHRPTRDPKARVDVHVSAGLYQVVDLDQRHNLATLSGYFDAWWQDEFITWNETEYDDVSKVFIPARWIWRPEFYLYHSIQGRMPDYASDATAEIRSDGVVRLFVPITSRALCPINVKYFPFDEQNCSFYCGSWTYQSQYVRFIVDKDDIFLGDFYDNQEWLLMNGSLHNGTIRERDSESFSMVYMALLLRRQSFYYIFNLVFPTTLVSVVAIVGFHAPINATGRRESKFRLGIMTLLSMSVMLLMLVGEMKFAFESIPGQRGIFYMIMIALVGTAACWTSIFVHLEKYALRNQDYEAIPKCLRWAAVPSLLSLVPRSKNARYSQDPIARSETGHSSPDCAATKSLMAAAEERHDSGIAEKLPLVENQSSVQQKLDLLITVMREFVTLKQSIQRANSLPIYWERLISRFENVSLFVFLSLITLNLLAFMNADLWY